MFRELTLPLVFLIAAQELQGRARANYDRLTQLSSELD
jgi:hypothetical protein